MNQDLIDILLVDDETRNLDALEAILASPSYRLIIATGGDEALRMLLEHDVAAIVLDIRMPGVSGFELAQIIKRTKRFRQIPIVFLTAHMMEDQDVIAGYGAGAVDYLTKPVNPEVLRHKIGVFAELFRKTRALAELNETLEARVEERTAELARSAAALEDAARHKDEFLATLAHELRNPLAPIRMGMDLLLKAPSTSDESKKTLTVMNRQLDHMVRLVDDLLDVARISGGKLELKKAPVDLAQIIQTAIETCQPALAVRKQTVVTRNENTRIAMTADPTRIAQIVANLIQNASKYTPEGGTITVELVREANDLALIRVIDIGTGIAPDQIERVFDMFARVEGQKSGLGIGLALSRRLAAMHDGTLTASSDGIGKGSTFTLSMPIGEASVVEKNKTTTNQEAAPSPAKRTGKPDILIIEDNADAADMLAVWLANEGYATTIARSGMEGLEKIRGEQPAIVLCDIGLPDIDGVELCTRARALQLDARPTMIALTGWGMESDRARTRDAGFDHHLVKPVAPDVLLGLLAQIEKNEA